MGYTCHARCELIKSDYQGFDVDTFRCTVCDKFFKTRNVRCECCGNILQRRPQPNKFNTHYYKQYGELKRY